MTLIDDSHRPAGEQRSRGPGHFNRWRRGLGLGLVACSVTVAGCGGSSHGSADQTTTAALASASNEKALPTEKAARERQSKPTPRQRATAPGNPEPRDGAHRDRSASSPQAAGNASPQPDAKTGKKAAGKKGQAKSPHSSVKPNGTKGPAHLPPPPSSAAGLPPGMSVYDAARQVCSDPDALEVLPPESRNDAELIAGIVEGFAPPGGQQDAHDGCIAGLKTQGIG
jgi:hypothetical protein